jgi:hypothetical protein
MPVTLNQIQPPQPGEPEQEQLRELREAVERIHQRYGADLSAFRRDVVNQLAKREDPHSR